MRNKNKYPQTGILIFSLSFLLFFSKSYAEICLVMRVSNDEKVIKKSLESIKNCIDCLCIYNDGSTDGTLGIIRSFQDDLEIPLVIVEQTDAKKCWIAAQMQMKELGCNLSSSYLLFLEPGSVLNDANALKNQTLTEDAYSCITRKTKWGLRETDTFLVNASLSWEMSSFPEWTLKSPCKALFLSALRIDETDEELHMQKRLLQCVKCFSEDDPKELFYLAQSYKMLRDYEKAIQLHQKHIHSSNCAEKIWFSHCMIAECYEAMRNFASSEHWYLQAYQYDPSRPEPLLALASYYRKNGLNHLAYFFAKQGSRIEASPSPTLWKEPLFLPYQFDEELSICAYYTPHRDEGEAAANELLLRKNVPWHIKDQTYKNVLFYVQKLQESQQMPIDFVLPLIHENGQEHYHPLNPSIQKTPDGYLVICRTVNYTQTGAKEFYTSDPTGVFRTRNFLLEYDRDFHLLSQKEIIEDLQRVHIRSFNIEGLDDCRIFNFQEHIWFSCCTGDTNPFGNFQISLCQLSSSKKESIATVEQLIPLQGPDPYRCEKNWLPFIRDDKIQLIYSYDPFLVITPNLHTGECNITTYNQPDFDFSHFRGSGGPIAFDDGYLLLVHEVVLNRDFSRCYLHRFLFLDANLTITKISKPFFFTHQGVEYCCSMTLDHTKQQLIIPIGIEDREAYLHFFDCDVIRRMLLPLNTISPIFQTQN